MKKHYLHFLYLLSLILLLSACFAQKTPQEVTQAFWESIINDDSEAVTRYSTLTEAKKYDGFSKDWNGFHPSFGKIVIDGNKASIVSEFSQLNNPQAEKRKLTTYLVRQNKEWKVDYDQTHENIRGDVFTNLLGHLGQLGSNISKQLSSSAKDLNAEMERMSKQLEALSDSLRNQANESVNKYGEILRQSIKEFEESIEKALKEQDKNLSDKEKRTLNEIIVVLNKDSENLTHPNIQSITESRENVHMAQQRLDAMDNEIKNDYKNEWHDWGEKFETNMNKMLEELSDLTTKEI